MGKLTSDRGNVMPGGEKETLTSVESGFGLLYIKLYERKVSIQSLLIRGISPPPTNTLR